MRALLLCIFLTSAARADCNKGKGTKKSTADVVHEAWEPLTKEPGFIGLAVGVIRSGESKPYKGFTGIRNPGLMPIKPDGQTLYEIGSITKTFTGVLLAFAHQKGKVDPADLVSKYLPSNVKLLSDRSNITLSDLAIHGAGFMKTPCNNDCPTKVKDSDNPNCVFTTDQLWKAVATCPLAAAEHDKQDIPDGLFVPDQVSTVTNQDDLADLTPFGSRNTEITPHMETHYSNLGFIALGRLLEKPMGDTWEKLVSKHITDPLGMKGTVVQSDPIKGLFSSPNLGPVPDAAWPNGNALSPWKFGDQPVGNPAGALVSNIDDMVLFLDALMTAKVPNHADLGKAITEALTPVPYGSSGKTARGFGVDTDRLLQTGCAEMVWKGGAMPGFRSWMGWVPSDGNGVVVLANWSTSKGDEAPTQIGHRILRALHGLNQ